MISTAVMVGEIKATDWANRAGNPSTLERSPTCFWTVRVEGVFLVIVTVTSPYACVPPRMKQLGTRR